jgi:TonB family protein
MPKTLLILIACFIASVASAQNNKNKPTIRPDSVGYYMRNETDMANSQDDAKFVRLLIKTDSNMFRVNDYYMNGTTRLVAKTTVDQINFERGAMGICYEYYPNGKRKSIKYFDKGLLVGDAVTYYPNGGLHTKENHSSQGIYLKQYLDTAGNVLASDGKGLWLKGDEEKKDSYMEGPILNGKEDGNWKRYVADTVFTIVYKQGEIISGKEFLNKVNVFDVAPSFPGGDAEFGKYLSRNIRYPVRARQDNVQGRVVLTFMVEKDGTISNIRILRGLGGGCDEESIRVLSLSPKWKPGLNNGKPVRVQYSMPINFSLQYESTPANNWPSRRSF